MTTRIKLGIVVLGGLGVALAAWAGLKTEGAQAERTRVTRAFSVNAPVQSSMEAPVEIQMESSGYGAVRVTLTFLRPATNVTAKAYCTEGARALGDATPVEGDTVAAGDTRTFECGLEPNADGNGLFAVYVTGQFEGSLHMARAFSVRLGDEPTGAASMSKGAKIVTDSEGRRVHAMPAGD